MVNGQILCRGEEWATDSERAQACCLVKGESSPSSSEWTKPASSVTSSEGDFDALDDSRKQGENSECRIIVEADTPFRVREASPAFLELFQFTEREVVGRSFRVCQGPKTDHKALMQFIKSSDCKTEMEAVFYSKDGDEIAVLVRAGAGNSTDGYALYMKTLGHAEDTPTAQNLQSSSTGAADFVLTTQSEDLFAVKAVGSAFTTLCGFPESQLREEGIGLIIGPGADGMKWKNLLNHGMEGSERECHLRIQSVHGASIPVRLRVTPRVEGTQRKVTELAFVCSEARDRASTSDENASSSNESSSSSFGSVTSGMWDTQNLPNTGGRMPSIDRSVLVHLQAMRLAKSKDVGEAQGE
jgi:hypothetical protein